MLPATCYAAALIFVGTLTSVAAAQETTAAPAPLQSEQPNQENDAQFAWDLLGLLGLAGLFGLRYRLPRSLSRAAAKSEPQVE
jgi:hypothetical protein